MLENVQEVCLMLYQNCLKKLIFSLAINVIVQSGQYCAIGSATAGGNSVGMFI